MPLSQSPAFKAKFVSFYQPQIGNGHWTFRRKGYIARLPVDLAEPWYSYAYMDALMASGLRGIKLRSVLQSLPHSLSAAIMHWRQSDKFQSLSMGHRKNLDMAAERLCREYGWVDVRRLTDTDLEPLLPDHTALGRSTLRVLWSVLKHADYQHSIDGRQEATRATKEMVA